MPCRETCSRLGLCRNRPVGSVFRPLLSIDTTCSLGLFTNSCGDKVMLVRPFSALHRVDWEGGYMYERQNAIRRQPITYTESRPGSWANVVTGMDVSGLLDRMLRERERGDILHHRGAGNRRTPAYTEVSCGYINSSVPRSVEILFPLTSSVVMEVLRIWGMALRTLTPTRPDDRNATPEHSPVAIQDALRGIGVGLAEGAT